MVNLGVLLQQQGDIAGARAWFQRAIATGPPEVREVAAELLRNVRSGHSRSKEGS
jgi:hypothetical protein